MPTQAEALAAAQLALDWIKAQAGQPVTPTPPAVNLTFPTYSIRKDLIADPKGKFAEVWIDLDKPVRHNCYVRVTAGGVWEDGTVGRVDTLAWFKTGEPQSQQILIPLTGKGSPGKTIAVTAKGSGISNNPAKPTDLTAYQTNGLITFKADAPPVVVTPYAKRTDRVPTRKTLVWGSTADWSNFQAKRGGGDGVWADGYDGYDNTNGEPTTYGAKGDFAGHEPWEIRGGDLVLRVQNLGQIVVSKISKIARLYAASILRGVFLARREATYEVFCLWPSGDGSWPAIWTLPDKGWPPEQDAMEGSTGKLGVAEFYQTMHAEDGFSFPINVNLRNVFNDPALDPRMQVVGHIMEWRADYTTTWAVHPDGRMAEVGCWPTQNGGKAMYPVLDMTLWGAPATPIPAGKPAAYEMRVKSLKVFA